MLPATPYPDPHTFPPQATFKEFDVGHLDVVFAMKDEVQHYVLHRLLLPPTPLGPLA